MKGSIQENLNQSPKPAINTLVETVGSHVSDSDKETLTELISFGDKRKAEGKKMEKEWWGREFQWGGLKLDKSELFRKRCTKFDQLQKARKEKEEETLKVLFSSEMMQGYLLDKYIEEYLYKWILYYPSGINEEVIDGGRKVVEGYDAVLEYLRAGNMETGVVIDLGSNSIGPDGAKYLAAAIKEVGLPSGVKIDLGYNKIGDDGVKYLAAAINQVGLAPGDTINLGSNSIGPDGAKYLAAAIKEVGLPAGVQIDLKYNDIGPNGVKVIAEAIKLVGRAPGVRINLGDTGIGDDGVKYIAEAIKEVGLAPGVEIDLWNNNIGDIGGRCILEALNKTGLPIGAIINLLGNNLSPEMKEQLSELNKTVEGEIIF